MIQGYYYFFAPVSFDVMLICNFLQKVSKLPCKVESKQFFLKIDHELWECFLHRRTTCTNAQRWEMQALLAAPHGDGQVVKNEAAARFYLHREFAKYFACIILLNYKNKSMK